MGFATRLAPTNAPVPAKRTTFTVDTRRRFFEGIVRQLRESLDTPFHTFAHRGDFNLMKVWYANPRVHYEVVIDQHISAIEVGLHFEDGPISTMAYLRLLDTRVVELKHELGWHVELERWTSTWGRLYELTPLETIDAATARATGARLAAFIRLLQPIIETAGVPAERSAMG
jgi:hypothetical protein